MKYSMLQQDTMQKLQRNPLLNFCMALCAATLSISVLVVAMQYDRGTSPCANVQYIIDLPLFLYILGAIGLTIAGLTFLFALLTVCEKDETTQESLARVAHGARLPVCCTVIFNLIWAGLGLTMYANQMSAECKETAIGITVFTWSMVMYAVVFSVGCCVCGMVSCLLCAGASGPRYQ